MADPLLTYAITTDPFPLEAGATSGATITVVATNASEEPVSLGGVSVQFPVGLGASQLTSTPKTIGAVPPAGWPSADVQTPTGYVTFVFDPSSPPAIVPKDGSLTFVFNDVMANGEPGTIAVTITEGSAGAPRQTLDTTKFPTGWGTVDFWVDPPIISAGGATTLHWNGPTGATYTFEYVVNEQIIDIPGPKQPKLGDRGTYPGQGQPPLTLAQTTVFTLDVSLDTYNAQQQKTVQVTPSLPTITSFTGALSAGGEGLLLTLAWETNADQCVLSGDPSLLQRTGTYDITPSVTDPLRMQYTLTAQNAAGSATSTLTVNWGIDAELRQPGVNSSNSALAASASTSARSDQTILYLISLDQRDRGSSLQMLGRTTLQPVAPPLALGTDPVSVIASPDGTRVYVLNGTDDASVQAISTRGGQLAILGGAVGVGAGSPGTGSPGMAMTPDGTKLFTANDDGTVSVLATSGGPDQPLSLAITISLGLGPLSGRSGMGIAASPDGKRVYVGANNALVVIDAVKDTLIGSAISLGDDLVPSAFPATPVAVTPDSAHVVVAIGAPGTVGTIRIFQSTPSPSAPLQDVGTFPGLNLMATGASADGKYFYVVMDDSLAGSTLEVVSIATLQAVGTPVTRIREAFCSITVSADGTNLYATDGGSLWSLAPVSIQGGTMVAPASPAR